MIIHPSAIAAAPFSLRLTSEESGYIQELKRRHPICDGMNIGFLLVALHNDCVNRIKEIAKSTICVFYPPSDKYLVDSKKEGLNILIGSQTFFNSALILSCARTIEIYQMSLQECSETVEAFRSHNIAQHQEDMQSVRKVYQSAQEFISHRKRSPSAKAALDKIREVLNLIQRMSACTNMLRECSDIDHFGSVSSSSSQSDDFYLDQKTLNLEIDFVKGIISNLWETPILTQMKNLFSASYKIEFLSISELIQQLNRNYTPSDLKKVDQVTCFSRKLGDLKATPEFQDPISIFLHHQLLQTQLKLNQCIDRTLKGRKLLQINPQAWNYCNTCIRLLPQLFLTYNEETKEYGLPSDLEGIFFMKQTLKEGFSSFSLFNFSEAREKVLAITPRIEEKTAFIQERVPIFVQTIESDLSKSPHPISEERLRFLQTTIDEAITPHFLSLLLLRLLLESVEKLLVSRSGCNQKILLSSTSVVFSDPEDQTKELKWYEDLEVLMSRLNVSLIYEQLQAKRAADKQLSLSHHDSRPAMVAETSDQPPPTAADPHISEVAAPASASTSYSRETPRLVKQPAVQKGTMSKRKVVSVTPSSKKSRTAPGIESGSSSTSAEELPINPSDLQTRKYRHLERLLTCNGFVKKSVKGSHEKWVLQSNLEGKKKLIVPKRSSTIALGTLNSIIKEANSILQRATQHN